MVIDLKRDANAGIAVLKKKDGYITNNFKEMSWTLSDNVKIGTNIEIKSDNTNVKPHRGKYYALFVREFNVVHLLYLDVNQNLRVIYTGPIETAVYNIYRMISDGMVIKVLQSNQKRAYRVVDAEGMVINYTYKNKSSEKIDSVYLNLYDAIQFAAYRNHLTGKLYRVITPKGTALFEIGR